MGSQRICDPPHAVIAAAFTLALFATLARAPRDTPRSPDLPPAPSAAAPQEAALTRLVGPVPAAPPAQALAEVPAPCCGPKANAAPSPREVSDPAAVDRALRLSIALEHIRRDPRITIADLERRRILAPDDGANRAILQGYMQGREQARQRLEAAERGSRVQTQPTLVMEAGPQHPATASPPLNGLPRVESELEEIERQLRTVPAHYNAPESLRYNRTTEISLALDGTGHGVGRERLKTFEGTQIDTLVRASRHVSASLTGTQGLVEIRTRGGEAASQRLLTTAAPIQWVWDVKALAPGTAVLTLDVQAHVTVDGEASRLQFSTMRHSIPIVITMPERAMLWLSEFSPLWASVAALVTALGSVVAWFGLQPRLRGSGGA